MVRALVLRGAGAGAVAGLLAFVFAWIFAEPLVARAIDYEGGREEAMNALAVAAGQAPAESGADVVSREVQGSVGLGAGIVLLGAAFGLLLALAFCLYQGRAGRLRPRTLVMLLAGAGFATLYLVPFLKYPANPPAVGHEETISDRTGLYLLMVLASVLFAVLAVDAGQRLSARFGTWNATLLAGAGFAVVMGILMAVLPALGELSTNVAHYGVQASETPQPLTDPAGRIVFPGFDADLLATFRAYALMTQVILWGALGLIFAPLAERVTTAGGLDARSDDPVAVG